MTHVAASGRLSGTVLDDGQLGSANVSGSTAGQGVTFTKRYLDPTLQPIEYEGTVSEDGRSMSGHWVIRRDKRVTLRGTWEMHRAWAESEAETESRQEEAVEALALPRVGASRAGLCPGLHRFET